MLRSCGTAVCIKLLTRLANLRKQFLEPNAKLRISAFSEEVRTHEHAPIPRAMQLLVTMRPATDVTAARAPGPLYSERLADYRVRLLRSMLKHSKTFARSDLDIIRRDPVAFAEVEKTVYADSIAASSSPDSVEPGRLRMVTKRLASGHTVNEFIGSPHAWMDRFAGARRFVTNIDPKHNKR
jgi:hypothetical protein